MKTDMSYQIAENYQRVLEAAPEINAIDLFGPDGVRRLVSLAYLVGRLDGGEQAKRAIDEFFAAKEIEAGK